MPCNDDKCAWLQDVRAGYKSNIERPLERLAKEATKQFKHRKGTVTTADVALNKRSLSRWVMEAHAGPPASGYCVLISNHQMAYPAHSQDAGGV